MVSRKNNCLTYFDVFTVKLRLKYLKHFLNDFKINNN